MTIWSLFQIDLIMTKDITFQTKNWVGDKK